MKCTMFMSFTLLLSVDAKGEAEAQICQDKIIILSKKLSCTEIWKTALLYKQDGAELNKCSSLCSPWIDMAFGTCAGV